MDATELIEQARKPDNATRLKVGPQLVAFLDGKGKLDSRQADQLIDVLTDWLQSSNFKICLLAIDVLNVLVFKLSAIDRHLNTVLPALLEALKNSSDQVREQIQHLLGAISDKVGPASVAEKIVPNGFAHKAWRVREEILIWLLTTLDTYGKEGLQLSKILPSVCALVTDATVDVRETAVTLLVEIYKHVGDRVRLDIEKKNLIDASKRKAVFQKFDEVKKTGLLKSPTEQAKPLPEASALSKVNGAAAAAAATTKSSNGMKSLPRTKKLSAAVNPLESADFQVQFDEIDAVNIYSARSLEEELGKIRDTCENTNNDWNVRVSTMKKLRGYLKSGAAQYPELMAALKDLTRVLAIGIKDLRSQVCREACICVAYLHVNLGVQAAALAEGTIPTLMTVVPNSAKIMANSAATCLMYTVQYVHSPKIIPIILSYSTNKSIPIRKQTARMLEDILRNWDQSVVDKQLTQLEDCILKLISDAHEETRTITRKAFFALKDNHPARADVLMGSMDMKVQRKLMGEQSQGSSQMSLARSQNSLASSQESLGGRSVSSVSARMTAKPSSTGVRKSHSTHDVAGIAGRALSGGPRRVSATATITAEEGSAAAAIAEMRGRRRSAPRIGISSLKPSGGLSPVKSSPYSTPAKPPVERSPLCSSSSESGYGEEPKAKRSLGPGDRSSRSSRMAQSQPASRTGSRGTSPQTQSRLGIVTNPSAASPASRSTPRRSGIPRSVGGSREHSPTRSGYSRTTPRSLQLTQSSATARFARTPTERAASSSKPTSGLRTLSRNPETEQAIASALQQSAARRGRADSYHYSDDDSDACSVQSYGSVGYGGDYENMSEVLRKCASQDWSERKEGLINLQVALKADTPLTRSEIKRATEIFTRMFSDPHVKVLSLFLEVLAEFVELYRDALQDWAGLLLTKLIQKTGAENLLNSGLTKVNKCLDIVRDVFPVDQQCSILMRFISDQTQTKSLKVKISVLKYLLSIISDLQPVEFSNTAETRQAVQIILSWSQDKAADIRKLSHAVLTSLFDLNTSEFNALQGILPKNYQDLCNKILLEYVNNYQSNDPSTVLSSIGNSAMSPPNSLNLNSSGARRDRKSSASSARSLLSPKSPHTKDEVMTSLKKTTAEIANYKFDTAGEGYDSGIPSMPNSNLDLNAPDVPDKSRHHQQQSAYNPIHYQADDDDDEDFLRNEEEAMEEDEKLVESLLQELSNHNTRIEQRKSALISLTKLIKEGNQVVWEEHFRTCLLMLFETMGDREHVIRTLALRVLREFLKHQQHRFQPFAEITILKTLEAHKDPSKEVVRAAEELTLSVLQAIPHKHCLQVLCPVISTGEFPINQTAIKMVTKIVEDSSPEVVEQHVDAICTSLIKAYQHQESSVRKDSVYGLVAVHQKVAPNVLDQYTKTLAPGKLKLLKLYIMRANDNKT